jgi:hypothetical protein
VAEPEASGDDLRDADQRQHEHQREDELQIAYQRHSSDSPRINGDPLALGEFVSEARQLVLKFDEADQP